MSWQVFTSSHLRPPLTSHFYMLLTIYYILKKINKESTFSACVKFFIYLDFLLSISHTLTSPHTLSQVFSATKATCVKYFVYFSVPIIILFSQLLKFHAFC